LETRNSNRGSEQALRGCLRILFFLFPSSSLGTQLCRSSSFDSHEAVTHANPLQNPDRGREEPRLSPPSEPCMRFSRTRLSSWWFQHRGWLAKARASTMVKSPCSAKKAFGQRVWSARLRPIAGRFCCLRSIARSRRRMNPSSALKVPGAACLK